jgi:hypothetical protein
VSYLNYDVYVNVVEKKSLYLLQESLSNWTPPPGSKFLAKLSSGGVQTKNSFIITSNKMRKRGPSF